MYSVHTPQTNEVSQNDHNDESVLTLDLDNQPQSEIDKLREEQLADETLQKCWSLSRSGKGNFFERNGLLFHRDTMLGQPVEQFCLPQCRREQVCKLAHDLCHQGYKRTKEKVRMSFYWDTLSKTVKHYVDTCHDCQLKARALIKDRVPISVIPHDEIPFSHLYMDAIGPLFEKAEFNYALCITDSRTRFPFCFPLRATTAKAVCEECLIQVFSALVLLSLLIRAVVLLHSLLKNS